MIRIAPRTASILVLFFVCAAITSAQVPATQCVVSTNVTPPLRSEGFTELTGDIVITCTGGNIIEGKLVPQTNISLALGTAVTSRRLNNAAVSDALLLIDEPTTGNATDTPVPGYGPGAPLIPCPNPGPTQANDTLTGLPPGCLAYGYQVPGLGGLTYNISTNPNPTGGPASAPSPSAPNAANVYQGVVSGNQVTWLGVPIDAPGTTGKRIFRITNVRANASALSGGSAAGATPVQASILVSNSSVFPITNPTPIVGFVQGGLSAQVTNHPFAPCQPLSGSKVIVATVSYTENFATAFKTRVDALPTSSGGFPAPVAQDIPGVVYNAETGFYAPGLGGNYTVNGLADFGTRLKATFNNIPAGVTVFVAVHNNNAPSQGPLAALVGTETGPAETPTPLPDGTVQVPIANGSGNAVWEILAHGPSMAQSFAFNVYFGFTTDGTPSGSPAPGTATVNLSLAPTVPAVAATEPIPAFAPSIVNGKFALGTLPDCSGALTVLQAIGLTRGSSVPLLYNGYGPGPIYNIPIAATTDTISGMQVTATTSPAMKSSSSSESPSASPRAVSAWLTATLNSTTTPATLTLAADPSKLAPGMYPATVTITPSSPVTTPVVIPVQLTIASPAPSLNALGVVNAASFVPGGLAPGEIATIFGSNLTTANGINLAAALPLATQLLNAEVKINDTPVPIFAVDNVNGQEQINFQVPWEVASAPTATVAVSNNGTTGTSVTIPVVATQPGIFAYDVDGNIFGAILHANFQLADTGHPATAGETLLIYCTGLGAVKSPPADGAAGSGQPTVAAPSVTIGGVNAPVSFSGLAPGFVGLYQINAVVPQGLASGNQPVLIMIDDASSNSVLLPVH